MYRTIEDFIKFWKYESESTIKTFKYLTAASLSFKVSENGRSLGFIAWHIVLTLGEMGGHMGLKVNAPPENSEEPKDLGKIISAYEIAAKSLDAEVQTKWNDPMLLDEIEMYGEKWRRGDALSALIRHEIHHRAQMTVLMRQAGLKVPGIYGPAKEEWADIGMPAQR
ncbi:MAG: DinB family protein [Bacteroidota bacterium]|nr:DinB family protein [Bacteroidota bacterium]